MGAIQRAVILGVAGLLTGCGTIHDLPAPLHSIARAQEAPKATPVSKQNLPSWLAEGREPLPAPLRPSAEPTSIAHPVAQSAQDLPDTIVPHVEVERSAASLPVVELAPPVQPIPLHTIAEPDWRPASEFRSR
jgi:hypothetical protein